MIKSPVIVLVLFVLSACQVSEEVTADFDLLPSPQSFEISGTSSLSTSDITTLSIPEGLEIPYQSIFSDMELTAPEKAVIVASLNSSSGHPEGYTLSIEDDKILINASTEKGILYGLVTLKQLAQDASDQSVNLPLCEIEDLPKLAWRAIHIDVKHHREKEEYYYALMDELMMQKINAIIIEIEDKLQYESQPVVGSADALSIEQWRALSKYALARNISISPLVQGLGHASFILKHEQYQNLRDDPERHWAFNPLDSQTYEVQFDLYRDALKAFPHGKYLHVGGDEVHTTGRGSGKSSLELQMHWLNKVADFAEKNGRTPIFWDDMPIKHAELYTPTYKPEIKKEIVDSLWEANEHKLVEFLDVFPKNVIYMRWNYSFPQSYGNQKAMDWFSSNGLSVMGATAGQTSWILMPQNESNIDAIRSFAQSSIDKNIDGLLLTLWDDSSPHFELYKRGIAIFAEYTWRGVETSKEDLKEKYRHRAFGPAADDESLAFIDLLEKPVGFWRNSLLAKGDRVRLGYMNNPGDAIIPLPDPDSTGVWSVKFAGRIEKAEENLAINDSVATKISQLKDVSVRNSYRLEVYESVNRLTAFNSKVLLLLRDLDNAKRDARGEIITELQNIDLEFKALRSEMEVVFGNTRLLNKPEDYILDQHQTHLANQTRNMDWLFYEEMLFMEKLSAYL